MSQNRTPKNTSHVTQENPVKKVLIVDDNLMQRVSLTRILRKLLPDYKFVEAVNGQQAVELYKEHEGQFEFMIMDGEMPVLYGWEAMQQIKDWHIKTYGLHAKRPLYISYSTEEKYQPKDGDGIITHVFPFPAADIGLKKPTTALELTTFLFTKGFIDAEPLESAIAAQKDYKKKENISPKTKSKEEIAPETTKKLKADSSGDKNPAISDLDSGADRCHILLTTPPNTIDPRGLSPLELEKLEEEKSNEAKAASASIPGMEELEKRLDRSPSRSPSINLSKRSELFRSMDDEQFIKRSSSSEDEGHAPLSPNNSPDMTNKDIVRSSSSGEEEGIVASSPVPVEKLPLKKSTNEVQREKKHYAKFFRFNGEIKEMDKNVAKIAKHNHRKSLGSIKLESEKKTDTPPITLKPTLRPT